MNEATEYQDYLDGLAARCGIGPNAPVAESEDVMVMWTQKTGTVEVCLPIMQDDGDNQMMAFAQLQPHTALAVAQAIMSAAGEMMLPVMPGEH